ncbi:MAG: DUF1315 family protein [Gammaproteobacteria bacterium]|nr:MAG: DUF1315 family protein [Gammaproteobacteria bacterium]
MKSFLDAIDALTPEIYEALKEAVEIGKWPDGTVLTEAQREIAMQAVILYSRKLESEDDEPFTIGPDGEFRTAAAQKRAYLAQRKMNRGDRDA